MFLVDPKTSLKVKLSQQQTMLLKLHNSSCSLTIRMFLLSIIFSDCWLLLVNWNNTFVSRSSVYTTFLSFSGLFIPGFPKLLRYQDHHEAILKKFLPKIRKNFVSVIFIVFMLSMEWLQEQLHGCLHKRNMQMVITVNVVACLEISWFSSLDFIWLRLL